MKCLLCQQPLQPKISFKNLIRLDSKQETLCQDCFKTFNQITAPYCPTCYKIDQADSCLDCQLWERQHLPVHHFSLYSYNDAMKHYFKTYKFTGDYLLRGIFAEEIRTALKPYEKEYQLIPVPISSQTFNTRGFNQVTGLLDAAGLAYSDLLRKEHTEKQSHKNRQQRLQGAQVFHVNEKSDLKQRVLIVDDIYTTGATIQTIKQLVLAKGAKEVISFSLAR
ncbi:ComF family protein [Streptococcus moroccensis]|uniref:Competence protein ComFC n=1 Tax=Streptococcus moroccensis TaxID=1451356 RepID=A0ABT9YTK0_9STRE|nr:ComF family protein [Streptococcus moroccensis]MDQ0223313.1 competence protein ComFC [Streptococcus moroccensis]